jgi:hypothetical protein
VLEFIGGVGDADYFGALVALVQQSCFSSSAEWVKQITSPTTPPMKVDYFTHSVYDLSLSLSLSIYIYI